MNFKSRELLFVLVIGRMRLAFARGIDAIHPPESAKYHPRVTPKTLFSFFFIHAKSLKRKHTNQERKFFPKKYLKEAPEG